MERVPGARGLVAYVDDTCILGKAGFATSSAHFTTANGGRDSDLSLKRNVGLLLARLLGWSKIIFVDDDVTVPRTDLARLAGQLERYQFAGMTCPCFPDNSVVCHAHRLAKLPQDIFVSGGTLGVNCGSSAPSFFPDIYNEDWFFFGGAAARGELAKVGEVRQTPFDPYENPMRARHEEFGDLLAEGLYALIESVGEQDFDQILDLATARYWTSFINVRRGDIAHTEVHLQEFRRRDNCSDTVEAAINSLQTADASYQSNEITADLCVDFLAALRRDQETWRGIYRAAKTTDTMRDAMSWLNVTHWTPVRQAVLAPV